MNIPVSEERCLSCGLSAKGLIDQNNMLKEIQSQEEQLTQISNYNEEKCILLMTQMQKHVRQLKQEREARESIDLICMREAKEIISILEENLNLKKQEIWNLKENEILLKNELKEKSLKILKFEALFSEQSSEDGFHFILTNQLEDYKQLNAELKRKIQKQENQINRLSLIADKKETSENDVFIMETKALLQQKDSIINSLKQDVKRLEQRVEDISCDLMEVRDIHETSILVDTNCPSRFSIDQLVSANNRHRFNKLDLENPMKPRRCSSFPSKTKMSFSFKQRLNNQKNPNDKKINEEDEHISLKTENHDCNILLDNKEQLNVEQFYTINDHQLKSCISWETNNHKFNTYNISHNIQTDNCVPTTIRHNPKIFNVTNLSIPEQTEFLHLSNIGSNNIIKCVSLCCQTDDKLLLTKGCQTDDIKLLLYGYKNDDESHDYKKNEVTHGCQTNDTTSVSFGCMTNDISMLSHSCQTEELDIKSLHYCKTCLDEKLPESHYYKYYTDNMNDIQYHQSNENYDTVIDQNVANSDGCLNQETLNKEIDILKKDAIERENEIRDLRKQVHDQRLRVLDVKYDMRETIVSLELQVNDLKEVISTFRNAEEERRSELEAEWRSKDEALRHHVNEEIAKHSQLDVDNKRLREDIENFETRLKVETSLLKDEINKYEQAVKLLQMAKENLEADFDASMTSFENSKIKWRAHRKSMEEKITELTKLLQIEKLASDESKNEIDAWRMKYEELKNLSVKLEKQIDAYNEAMEKQTNIIKRRSEDFNSKENIKNMNNKNCTQESNEIILNVDLTNLTTENQRLISNISSYKLEIERLKKIIETKQNQNIELSKLKETLFETENKLKYLQMINEQLQDELTEQKKLLQSVDEKSKKRLSELTIEGSTFKRKAEEKESKVLELVQKFKNEMQTRKRAEENIKELTFNYDNYKTSVESERQHLFEDIASKNNEIILLKHQLSEIQSNYSLLKYEHEKLSTSNEVRDAELQLLKEEISKELTRLSKLKSVNVELAKEVETKSNVNYCLANQVEIMEKEIMSLQSNSELNKIKYEETISQQRKLVDFLTAKVENTPRKMKLFSGSKIEDQRAIH